MSYEDSKYKDFLNLMPKSLDNFPVMFSEKEMEKLTGSPFKYRVLKKKRDIQDDYD
jgi:hypothetical protein